MLGLARVAPAGARYYGAEPDLAAAGAGTGRWHGSGAAGLGLAGACRPADLDALLAGRRPDGRPLLPTDRRRAAGMDLVFTAPKSVSVLHGLGDDAVRQAVLAAHLDAVEGAMSYVDERAVVVRRRTEGASRTLRTTGSLGAGFTHGTSRAGDPHLHTHVVLANVAHGDDGRWSVLDARALWAHREAAGALYDAHLRHGLIERLGVGFAPVAPGRYEVEGIDASVRAEFSGRSAEIRAEGGPGASGAARRVAWARTRSAKEATTDAGGQVAWRGRASTLGLDQAALAATLTREVAHPAPVLDEVAFALALGRATDATTTRRAVVASWAQAAGRGAPAASVEAAVEVWAPTTGLGVAEAPLAISGLVVGAGVLERLGPRPAVGEGQAVWAGAARQLGAYRRRWGADLEARPASAMPARRVLEHLACERAVADVDRTVGGGRTGPAVERVR